MVFTVTLDFKDKINNSVLKEVEKSIKMLSGAKVYSGVIGEDERTTRMAYENEFGLGSVYDWGPFEGEPVQDPKRPFISAPIEKNAEHIGSVLSSWLNNSFNTKKIEQTLKKCGEMMSELQTTSILSRGSNIGGWNQFNGGRAGENNSGRTVGTKGFDFPLLDRHHNPFPIKYEVELGGA